MTAEQRTDEDALIFKRYAIDKITVPSEDMDWMVRPCRIYNEEYKECKSIRGRLHQYFIFGEFLDCNQWNRDYVNCMRWTEDNNTKSKMEVIKSECSRKNARLKAHYENDVWTERMEPPQDWNKPLPDWLVNRNKDTYLARKSEELKGIENVYAAPFLTKNCTIL